MRCFEWLSLAALYWWAFCDRTPLLGQSHALYRRMAENQ